MNVLYIGSGAVNLCLAGWMHSGTNQTSFLVRTADNELIRTQAFQCRLPGDQNMRVYKCNAVSSLQELERPDLVVIGVKSYSLNSVIKQILEAFGSDVPVMSVLNGVRHVEILQKEFNHTVFATIIFNAYRQSPISAVAGEGSVILSSSDPNSQMLNSINLILKRKVSVKIASNPLDAARCKLVINLGNSILTIVGHHKNRNREIDVLQKISARVMWEGVQTVRKAGTKEVLVSGMPPWILLWLSTVLPSFVMVPIFTNKLKDTRINSMAQDMEAVAGQTEFEDINGYLIRLAEEVGTSVPYNRALYHIFKEWMEKGAQPMRPSELLSRINSFSSL